MKHPKEYLGLKVYMTKKVTEISEGVIVSLGSKYTDDGKEYLFFNIETEGRVISPRFSYPAEEGSETIFFSLEEAREAIAENLRNRRADALVYYKKELARIDGYEKSLVIELGEGK